MANISHFSLFFIFAFGSFSLLSAQDAEISQLEKYFDKKCLNNSGNNDAFLQLRNNVYEMLQYLKYAFAFLPNQKQTFCDSERKNLIVRIKEIEKDLSKCFKNEEDYLPGFIRKSFQEFLHFLCHNDGEYSTRFFTPAVTDCRSRIENSTSNDLEYCLNRIFPPSNGNLLKKDMCDDLTVMKKCFVQALDNHCKTTYEAKNLNEIFFNYIQEPCNGAGYLSSGTLILFFALLLHVFTKFNLM